MTDTALTAEQLDIPAFLLRKNWTDNMPPPLTQSLVKPLVWSFTLLNTYDDVCPHQTLRRYVRKDIPYVETPEMKWGNDVHAALEYRVGGKKPLPVAMQSFEPFAAAFDGEQAVCEQKLGVTADGTPSEFFGDRVWGRGKLDVTIVKDRTAYLGDWKTGNSKYEKPFELEVQAVLLQAKYPHLTKIVGQYIWLKENRLGRMYDLSNTRQTWAKICDIMQRVERDRASGEWEKKQGPLCGFCDVKDCEKNKNPKYQ